MTPATEGLARSVQTRLVAHAKAIGDADLLGFGDLSDAALMRVLQDICAVPVAPDGLLFAADSIRVSAIRVEDPYGGRRVILHGQLGRARLRVQVDVGIGDVVVPAPEWLEYPSLLGLPRPRLRAYRRETVVAEKLHAMVVLGSRNSRLRDFFDVLVIAQREAFDGQALVGALKATFERRATPIPGGLPLALTPEFSASAEKQSQWLGFLRRSGVSPHPGELDSVVNALARFVGPPLGAAASASEFPVRWPAGGPWSGHARGDR